MDKTIIQNNLKKIQALISPLQARANDLLSKLKAEYGKEQSVIGIDVGTSSVKVVQMADVDGVMTIVKSAFVDIGGSPGNPEEVLASLKTALIGMETKGAKIVAVINCPQTCMRKIIAPKMPKKELAEAVRWEAKNAIPFSIEEAMMDYEIFGEVSEKGLKKFVVMVAASPQETINKMIWLFSKVGVEVSSIIPLSLCLQNLIAVSAKKREAAIAIVEMGSAVTELNIYQDGILAFSRKLPVAGNDITKSMTSTLMSDQGKIELSIEEAEKIKREQGIPSGEGTELVDGKILPSQILSLVRPCVEQLASEIDRSFDFYREESRGGRVEKIVLFGGGANLKGLAEFLHKELEIEVGIGNSLEDIEVYSGAVSSEGNGGSRFDLAIGAALNKADKINLLPVELKEKTKRFIENTSIKAVIVAIAMTLLLSVIGLRIQLKAQHKKMTALRLEQRILAPQSEKLRAVIIADHVLQDHPYWEDALREISNTIQPGMYLRELSMRNNVVNFKGVIVQKSRGAQATLSNFMIKLEEGIFRNVSLVTTKKETVDAAVSEFEITAEVE